MADLYCALYCALYATPLAYSSTPRLWVWVRRLLERLVAPSVRQEPAWLVRSRTGAHTAVVWLAHEQRRLDVARKGGERR